MRGSFSSSFFGSFLGVLASAFICMLCGVLGVAVVILQRDSDSLSLSEVGVSKRVVGETRAADRIAVVYLRGAIVEDESTIPEDVITPAKVRAIFEDIAKDESIKAVVIHIESPGGSVVASDEIYHIIKQAKVPVVAYIGSIGASGGYYISLAAKAILAHPESLTGSIGVISEFIRVYELYEKLGIKSEIIKSGRFKDLGNPSSPFTEEFREYWQSVVEETHQSFVTLLAQSRNLSRQEASRLADGRPYTGRRAKALGLVDEVGYLEDALAEAAKLGGVDKYAVVRYEDRRTILEFSEFVSRFGISLFPKTETYGLQYR